MLGDLLLKRIIRFKESDIHISDDDQISSTKFNKKSAVIIIKSMTSLDKADRGFQDPKSMIEYFLHWLKINDRLLHSLINPYGELSHCKSN